MLKGYLFCKVRLDLGHDVLQASMPFGKGVVGRDDAIESHRSDEVFTPAEAESFMDLDLEVQRTRKPAMNRIETHPADKSPGFTVASVYPITDRSGNIIGTMRLYRVVTSHDTLPEWHGRLKNVVA